MFKSLDARTLSAVYALYALICFALLGFGFFLEHVLGLIPCPLCMTQRLSFLFCGTLALFGALKTRLTGSYGIFTPLLTGLFSFIGAMVAGRQLWLQQTSFGAEVSCGPGLGYLFEILPFYETLAIMFRGNGQCSEILWRFMGLSIPGWSLVFFTLLFVTSVCLLLASLQRS